MDSLQKQLDKLKNHSEKKETKVSENVSSEPKPTTSKQMNSADIHSSPKTDSKSELTRRTPSKVQKVRKHLFNG